MEKKGLIQSEGPRGTATLEPDIIEQLASIYRALNHNACSGFQKLQPIASEKQFANTQNHIKTDTVFSFTRKQNTITILLNPPPAFKILVHTFLYFTDTGISLKPDQRSLP